MKKFYLLLATVSLALVGSFSQAQANTYADDYMPWDGGYDCCFDDCRGRFDGLYLGVTGGWNLHDRIWVDRDNWANNFDDDFSIGTVHSRYNGVTFGLTAGYNIQCGCALFGFEVDGNWADIHGSKRLSPNVENTTLLTLRDRAEWFGTFRGRVGIVCDDLLLYLTSGLAVSQIRSSWAITSDTSERFHHSRVRWGGVIGTGAEFAISDCLSVKMETLYIAYPEHTKTGFSPSDAQRVAFDLIDEDWITRIGINYKL